ncbi:MAG: hypothetical protein LBE34_14075 [Flavobacteriaceae bacterium]|jgi:predicted SprT family Zn-dependent metalloprotease|nr:hypothetical protein [Flavobacteriaceae bacterium]
MKSKQLHNESCACGESHENNFFEPSIGSYVCGTCNEELSLTDDYELQEEDDEYALHIGI